MRLLAVEVADVETIAAICQDALFLPKMAQYFKQSHAFNIEISRFCWEDEKANKRVPAVLSFQNVMNVKAHGINFETKIPLSILSIEFLQDKEPPSGNFIINLAEGAQITLKVECIDIVLGDIGRSRNVKARPDHEL